LAGLLTQSSESVIPKAALDIVNDPIGFAVRCWPLISFYKEQRDIIYSVRDNDETIVPAANQLGKDFVAAFISIWWMMRTRPARVLATSPQATQLEDVLWGEIKKLLRASKVQLPLHSTHMLVRQQRNDGSYVDTGELRGQAVNKGEALLGRHLPRISDRSPECQHYLDLGESGIPTTLLLVDEGSGMDDEPYYKSETWAHRRLTIGNCYPTTNFFYQGTQAGDAARSNGNGFSRKIIKIRADQSPNVRHALEEIRAGLKPTNKIIIPGVKDYPTYLRHRETWDEQKQAIQLDAEFWEGDAFFLFPRETLNACGDRVADGKALVIGVDPAEGGDNTCWAVASANGVLAIISERTPNTSDVMTKTIDLISTFNVKPQNVLFDRGGGKQHADNLRNAKRLGIALQDYPVRTVGFGDPANRPPRKGVKSLGRQIDELEERYVYKNRRAQMYGILSQLLSEEGFAIPRDLLFRQFRPDRKSLYDQLRPLPRLMDRKEGQIYLPPKNRPKGMKSKETTIVELIGHSPDESDALALAAYGLKTLHAPKVWTV
jgi:hypothetical protein